MKATFNVHGQLTITGEDATEWLALRTWSSRWSADASPLVVVGKKAEQHDGYEIPVEDSRQLFRRIEPVAIYANVRRLTELDECCYGNVAADFELEQLRKDSARYRLLRRGQKWSVIDGIGDTLRGDELDAAIDATLKTPNV